MVREWEATLGWSVTWHILIVVLLWVLPTPNPLRPLPHSLPSLQVRLLPMAVVEPHVVSPVPVTPPAPVFSPSTTVLPPPPVRLAVVPAPVAKPIKARSPTPRPTPTPVADPVVTDPVVTAPEPSTTKQLATPLPPAVPMDTYQPPDVQAAYANNPKPTYPPSARRMGHMGTVMLTVEITQTGGVAHVTVKESSGFDALDRAAVTAVTAWQFVPAQRNGQPTAATVNVPIRFQLQKE